MTTVRIPFLHVSKDFELTCETLLSLDADAPFTMHSLQTLQNVLLRSQKLPAAAPRSAGIQRPSSSLSNQTHRTQNLALPQLHRNAGHRRGGPACAIPAVLAAALASAEKPLNIVFVSAEVAPWSKTGGLGDVAGELASPCMLVHTCCSYVRVHCTYTYASLPVLVKLDHVRFRND